ncbi:cache domain-containing protein [Magnetococcales bacterium HHB-1]
MTVKAFSRIVFVKISKNIYLAFLSFFALIFLILLISDLIRQWSPVTERHTQEIFAQLKEVQQKKKEEVVTLLKKQESVVNETIINKHFIENFGTLLHAFHQQKWKENAFIEAEKEIEKFYAFHLGDFYDLLLLDTRGNIFFTVKKENDWLTNIHDPRYKKLALGRLFSHPPQETVFVDYEYYPPSKEPASFFVAPVKKDGKQLGFVAFQFAINLINEKINAHHLLGQTGEVYLVNGKRRLMTESRFFQNNLFKERVDTEAVKNALQRKHGEKILLDYRGKRVYSAFERLSIFGHPWIIIAEIDEDEVLSNIYMKHEEHYFKGLLKRLYGVAKVKKNDHIIKKVDSSFTQEQSIRVDIHEFLKSEKNSLVTFGASSCTVLTVNYPKRFGYMAHISPVDEVYQQSVFNFDDGEKSNQLIKRLMHKIERFDIRPVEKTALRFGIFAVHNRSLQQIIRELLHHGIALSQITVAFHPEAESVNVSFDPVQQKIKSYWFMPQKKGYLSSTLDQWPPLGKMVHHLTQTPK